MAPKNPRNKHKNKPLKPSSSKFNLSAQQQFGVCFGITLIALLIYFYPIVFEGKVPPASDKLAWSGNAQSVIESRQRHESNPLWANNVFAGMPDYLISLDAPFHQPAKYVQKYVNKVINWRVTAYLIGAVGMLLLMRFWGLSYAAAFIAALAFIWWPLIPGLLEAGHNTKVSTIMFMPIITWSFLKLLRSPGFLYASLFAILFSLGIQARHYQIMFYEILLLVIFGVYHFATYLSQKDWSGIGKRTAFLTGALILAAGIASFPTLMVHEYTAYSIRGDSGGTTASNGADYNYATGWSLHPSEIMTFFIPRFYGGTSSELYEGDAVPQLKGQTIPGYWGHKLFTSSTDYIGVVSLIFAAFAFMLAWKNKTVMLLGFTIVLSLFVAFGKYVPFVYDLFYNFMPFFNKFRVPSMILVLVQFSVAILAGIGFDRLLNHAKEKLSPTVLQKSLLILLGLFLFIGIIPFLFKSEFSLARPEDAARMQANVLALVKEARYDLMKQDALRMLLFVAAVFATVFAFMKEKLSKPVFVTGIVLLLIIDLWGVDKRYLKTLVKPAQIDQHFAATPTDNFLLKDKSRYRIFPVGQLYSDSRWSYRHESIGGYHPAKLRLIQDIIESALYKGTASGFQNNPGLPINWNIVDMLNAKYILAPGRIQHPNLEQMFVDNQTNIVTYKNNACLPRIFAVGNVEIIADRQKRFARLNDPTFKPDSVAILEKPLSAPIAFPATWKSAITRYEPNIIEIDAETDQQTLMVLSEIYYPAGWHASVDGKPTEILKTDHALRSIVLPKGKHHVVFELKPATYITSLWMQGVSSAIVYLILILALIHYFRKRPGVAREAKETTAALSGSPS